MIDQLKHKFTPPLPGKPAQYKMAHAIRRNYPSPPEDARIACVLALLYPRKDDMHIVLIERKSNNKNDRHSGQISFPGGKYEDSDGTYVRGALREAEEEVGIHSSDVKVIGQLTDLYIPVSNFIVYPFVGYMDYTPDFVPQPTEVNSILEIPLSHLGNPKTIEYTDLKLSPQITLKKVPYYNVHGHIVWGATAMILSEFLEVVGK